MFKYVFSSGNAIACVISKGLLLILAALWVGSQIESKMENLHSTELTTLCLSTDLQTVSMVWICPVFHFQGLCCHQLFLFIFDLPKFAAKFILFESYHRQYKYFPSFTFLKNAGDMVFRRLV